MSSNQALQHHRGLLSDFERTEILDYQEVFFLGREEAKKNTQASFSRENNHGFDDERGDYKITIKDHLAYRYEVIELIGSGSFGQAFKCLDHKTQSYVAVKVIRNKKRF